MPVGKNVPKTQRRFAPSDESHYRNMYSYVRNNPLRFVDPSGLDPICPPQYIACATGTASGGGGGEPGGDPTLDCFFNAFLCGGQSHPNPPAVVNPPPPPPPTKPKPPFGSCMFTNQGAFSLASLIDQGSSVIGIHTKVSSTFLGNLFAGNDVMGVASLMANVDPDGTLATAVSQSAGIGIKAGLGSPTMVGGNSTGAVQRLFPKVGRPPQVLARSKNLFESKALSSLAGVGLDLLDGKDMIDLAMTAGLAFRCVQ